MEEDYPESIEDLTGGGKASGFIRAIMAKKRAGQDFDPDANKRGAPKKGLVNPDPRKAKEASKDLIKIGKSKVLKTWVDKEQIEKPKKGIRKRLHPPTKKLFISSFTNRQIDQVIRDLGFDTAYRPLNRLEREKVPDLIQAFNRRYPEKVKKIMEKKFPKWKLPGIATIKRKVYEKPETKEKRLAKAREYKEKKGLTKKKEPRNTRTMVGEGAPPEKLFWKSATHAYDKVAPNKLGAGFEKIMDSPTLDAYLRPSDRSILVASRGTNPTSIGDLSADAQLLMNRLKLTRRYKTDKEMLEKLMENFPQDQYEFFLSGHSLAGAIVQQLKRDFPQLSNAVTYNPAFQTADLQNQPGGVKRIYTDKDFLYNLGGKYFRNAKVIPATPEKAKGFFGAIKSALTPSGIKGHSLKNFEKMYGLGMRGGNRGRRRRRLRRELRDLTRRYDDMVGYMLNMNREYQSILRRADGGEVGLERRMREIDARLNEADIMLQTLDRRIENIQGELENPEEFRIGEREERQEATRRNIARDRDTATNIINRRAMLGAIFREVEGNIERMEGDLEQIGREGYRLFMDDRRGQRLRERRRAIQEGIQNQTRRREEILRELEGEVARYGRVMRDIESAQSSLVSEGQMEMEQEEEVDARAFEEAEAAFEEARAARAAAEEEAAPAAAAAEEAAPAAAAAEEAEEAEEDDDDAF